MKVSRTEKHNICKYASFSKSIDELCFKSKNIYNYANYIIRQEFIVSSKENGKGNWIRYNELANIVKDSEPYRDLGSNVGQQTLKVLDQNWKSFFAAIKDWSKHKEKYLGKPNLPKYLKKDGRFPLILDTNKVKITNGYLYFCWKPLKPFNNKIKTNVNGKLMQVRFIPRGGNYVLEIVYEIEVPEFKEDNGRYFSVDIGVDNLLTITNNFGEKPVVVNGRSLKSMNQYYNKKKASIQSELKVKENKLWSNKLQRLTNKRNNKVADFIHKASKTVIDMALESDVSTIVIGNNKNWKQESKLSRQVNQSFVGIPHQELINKIVYKAENVGINVILTEESYTSGTSFLDNEEPIKENYDKSRRKYRGLFISNQGIKINADVNGSYQIMKKVIPNAFADGIEGVGLHPVRLNI